MRSLGPARKLAFALAFTGALWGMGASSLQPAALAHEHLRLRNNFKNPEEVVAYYCARDASGFVWSGLLESERAAFTTWADAPERDSFYIAKQYAIGQPEFSAGDRSHASVEVHYELVAMGDGSGNRNPAPQADYRVRFDLKKIGAAWKIVHPDSAQIPLVVLESKFLVSQ
jgi:hypothetical protein